MSGKKVLVIIPTRGRPEWLRGMLTACIDLSEGRADFAVATDADDSHSGAYRDFLLPLVRAGRALWYQRARSSPSDLVNHIARNHAQQYFAVGYFSDDLMLHPRSAQGWDVKLLEAVESAGGSGITYGNDLYQTPRLPIAPIITSDIVLALGWFCEPTMGHYYVDNVWYDLGTGADCLAYREDVVIEHCHHTIGKSPPDLTYAQAVHSWWNSDTVAYNLWCHRRREADTEKVRRVVQARRGQRSEIR
jgi:hypothetical protein